MVLSIPIVGWLGVIVGSIGVLFGRFTNDEDAFVATIAFAAIMLVGTGFLVMYRNSYVAPGKYEVAFRTVLGKERVIT
jgi:hypothetical protein